METLKRDFIKCDVEGGELEVIWGAKETIPAHTTGWFDRSQS
jgi:Methyltransferase FkbM domain